MKYFTVEVKNHIAVVTFSRPPVNAYNDESYAEMYEAFTSLNGRKDIYAAIFHSEGKWCSPGNDLKEAHKEPTWQTQCKTIDVITQAKNAFRHVEVPVISCVQGYCLGAGILATNADIVIAGESAKFGMPEVKVGVCSGWTELRRFTSPQMARYMCYSGAAVSAQELFRFGHILKIVEDDKLLETAFEIAESFANTPPTALRFAKRAMNHDDDVSRDAEERLETICSEAFFRDHYDERMEALNAFIEKRPARYFND